PLTRAEETLEYNIDVVAFLLSLDMRAATKHRGVIDDDLDFIKAPGVFSKYRFFVFILEVMSLDDFVDLFHAVVEGNLVWKVRGEHERLGSDALDRIGQGPLVALAADEHFAALKIVFGFALDAQTAVLQFSFQAVDHHGNPARAPFQEADAEIWERIEYAID